MGKRRNSKRRKASGLTLLDGILTTGPMIGILFYAHISGGATPTNSPVVIICLLTSLFMMLRLGIRLAKQGDWMGYVFLFVVLVGLPMGVSVNGNPSQSERNGEWLERTLNEIFLNE